MHLIVHSVISLSSHLSICWPFPAMPVVRVSVYLPWRPADVYCDEVEYSSYQYGLHQCWISHSGLAGCPPAAYSNIVSRIVIFEAELWLSSLQAPEYSQRKTLKEIVSASILKQNVFFFFLLHMWILDHVGLGGNTDGFGECLQLVHRGEMEGWKNDGKQKPTKAKIGHESVPWSLIHGVLLFSPSFPFSHSPSHVHLGVKAIDVLPLMAKRGLY